MRTCPYCAKVYSSRSSLWLHRRLKHPDSSLSTRSVPCSAERWTSDHEIKSDKNNSQVLMDQDAENYSQVLMDQDDDRRKFYHSDESSDSDENGGSDYRHRGVNALSGDTTTEDEESEGETSDVFGKCDDDENDRVYLTSESEGSFSESEVDDEEIDINVSRGQDTYIRWPISKDYRIKLPWTYWGSEPKVKKHRGWIKRFYEKENSTIVYNVKRALDAEIATLCEIAYNCLNYQLPIHKSNLTDLRKHRRALHLLVDPSVSIKDKRECILLHGASFVNSILHCIDPLIRNQILSTIKPPDMDASGESEGEEEEEEES